MSRIAPHSLPPCVAEAAAELFGVYRESAGLASFRVAATEDAHLDEVTLSKPVARTLR
jgi:hypothetical protein